MKYTQTQVVKVSIITTNNANDRSYEICDMIAAVNYKVFSFENMVYILIQF